MMKWDDVIAFDLTPAQKKLALRIGWRVALITHIFWACGWLAVFGLSGFVRADDMRRNIESATKPLEATVAEQNKLLERVSRQLIDQLASSVAAEIRAKIAKRCAEPDSRERERLNGEIYRLQQQYVEYKGSTYTEPACNQL